jgi:type IV pilus assembly protein PilN
VIRTNLATRPFYNERAVALALVAAAILVAAFTVFNVTRALQLSHSDTRLATEASQNEARARELRASAARLRASVDPRGIELASSEARLANDLIDRRTFSWTEVFNRFEATLPADVRITSVHPSIDRKRGIVLGISVVARSVEDVNQFMENLEQTGAFAGLLARDEQVNEQGMLEAMLETTYLPSVPAPPAAPAKAATKR